MTSSLQDLLRTGDALCEGGDFVSLIHVVAEIERVATDLERPELAVARTALDRWQSEALDRRMVLGSALVGQRSNRGALKTYGAVAAG